MATRNNAGNSSESSNTAKGTKQQTAATSAGTTNSTASKSANDFDATAQEADSTTRTRKPGSQSNSSKQGNNGRGGGKH